MDDYTLHGTTDTLSLAEAVSAIAEHRGISEDEAAVLWLSGDDLEQWREDHEKPTA